MTTFMSREEAALVVFNGDAAKAEALLNLIGDTGLSCPPEEFTNRSMQLPVYDCSYCTDSGECWHDMPDSMYPCKGKCEFFAVKTSEVEEAAEEEVAEEPAVEPVPEEEPLESAEE